MKNNIFLAAIFGLTVFGLSAMDDKKDIKEKNNEEPEPVSTQFSQQEYDDANFYQKIVTGRGQTKEVTVEQGLFVGKDGKIYRKEEKLGNSTEKTVVQDGVKSVTTPCKSFTENYTLASKYKNIQLSEDEIKKLKLNNFNNRGFSLIDAEKGLIATTSSRLTDAQKCALAITGVAVAGAALYIYREPVKEKVCGIIETAGDVGARIAQQAKRLYNFILPPVAQENKQ